MEWNEYDHCLTQSLRFDVGWFGVGWCSDMKNCCKKLWTERNQWPIAKKILIESFNELRKTHMFVGRIGVGLTTNSPLALFVHVVWLFQSIRCTEKGKNQRFVSARELSFSDQSHRTWWWSKRFCGVDHDTSSQRFRMASCICGSFQWDCVATTSTIIRREWRRGKGWRSSRRGSRTRWWNSHKAIQFKIFSSQWLIGFHWRRKKIGLCGSFTCQIHFVHLFCVERLHGQSDGNSLIWLRLNINWWSASTTKPHYQGTKSIFVWIATRSCWSCKPSHSKPFLIFCEVFDLFRFGTIDENVTINCVCLGIEFDCEWYVWIW